MQRKERMEKMKFKKGQRVIQVKDGGYDFDEVGLMGTVTSTHEHYFTVQVDGQSRAWSYQYDKGTWEPFYDTFDEDFNAYEDKPPTKAEMHRRICEELTKTYVKKNTDYGDSYGQLRARYPDSILIRIFDKFSRLERLLKGNKALVEDESIEDTLMDLANYAVMELVERRSK